MFQSSILEQILLCFVTLTHINVQMLLCFVILTHINIKNSCVFFAGADTSFATRVEQSTEKGNRLAHALFGTMTKKIKKTQ